MQSEFIQSYRLMTFETEDLADLFIQAIPKTFKTTASKRYFARNLFVSAQPDENGRLWLTLYTPNRLLWRMWNNNDEWRDRVHQAQLAAQLVDFTRRHIDG